LASGIRLNQRKANNPEISRLARKLHASLRREGPWGELSRAGLVLEVIAELIAPDDLPDDSCACRARDIILSGFRSHLRLSAVAEELAVHPSHLARTFRRRFGYTVGDFIREARIGHATRLLTHSDFSLSAISLECGFYDQSHFTAQFRAVMGTTPARFREDVRGTICLEGRAATGDFAG
jgi:AraC family transcriptional regulator